MWRLWTRGWGPRDWWYWVRREGFPMWVAWCIPRSIAYWVFIRVYAAAGDAGADYDRVCKAWEAGAGQKGRRHGPSNSDGVSNQGGSGDDHRDRQGATSGGQSASVGVVAAGHGALAQGVQDRELADFESHLLGIQARRGVERDESAQASEPSKPKGI